MTLQLGLFPTQDPTECDQMYKSIEDSVVRYYLRPETRRGPWIITDAELEATHRELFVRRGVLKERRT